MIRDEVSAVAVERDLLLLGKTFGPRVETDLISATAEIKTVLTRGPVAWETERGILPRVLVPDPLHIEPVFVPKLF